MSETTHVSSSNYTVILPSSAGAGVSVPVTFVDEYVPVGRPFVEYRNSNGEAVPVLDE